MAYKFAVIVMRLAEIVFFFGLSGCAVVVILSWISVGGDCFRDKP